MQRGEAFKRGILAYLYTENEKPGRKRETGDMTEQLVHKVESDGRGKVMRLKAQIRGFIFSGDQATGQTPHPLTQRERWKEQMQI